MSDYKVKVKIQNNNILKMIKSRGYKSVSQFARENDLHFQNVNKFINLRTSPIDSNGKVKSYILKLCEKLDCSIEELFSLEQMEMALEENERSFEMREAEVKFMLSANTDTLQLDDMIFNEEKERGVLTALESLTPRHRDILKKRFGIGEETPHTLQELADIYGLGRERIRQIERAALDRLRLPHRADLITKFCEDI